MTTTLADPKLEIEYLTEIRQDLHAHPELGYEEHRTSEVVQRELSKAGIEFKAGLARGTGVLGYLPANASDPKTAKTVALRADMDALPIHEKTGLPYASQNPGKMHACGHDGHTTILIGTARELAKRSDRKNNILLIFQPAEEGGAGGQAMCEDGVLDGRVIGPPADCIFGLHDYSSLEIGQVITRPGAMMASADSFRLRITGKGGHGAMPHMGIDPIVTLSHIITALQTVASRNVSPIDSVVVTIGKIDAGTAHNIIPDFADLYGTIRTLKESTRGYAKQRVIDLVNGIAASFGANAEFFWQTGYPVTANDPVMVDHVRRTLKSVLGEGLIESDVEPTMGGEDFSFYGQNVPSCFFWLGLKSSPDQVYPNLHAAEFNFNDDAIESGVKAMTALALALV